MPTTCFATLHYGDILHTLGTWVIILKIEKDSNHEAIEVPVFPNCEAENKGAADAFPAHTDIYSLDPVVFVRHETLDLVSDHLHYSSQNINRLLQRIVCKCISEGIADQASLLYGLKNPTASQGLLTGYRCVPVRPRSEVIHIVIVFARDKVFGLHILETHRRCRSGKVGLVCVHVRN